MSDDNFFYDQHPHAQARTLLGPPTIHSVMMKLRPQLSAANLLNQKIGLAITKRVGSMWAAYAFALLSLVSFPAAIFSHDPIIIVAWIAQTFLQLVLLPVIIVGQNIGAAASDARAAATYEDAGAILEEAKQIQLHLAAQDRALEKLIERLGLAEERLRPEQKSIQPVLGASI